jgi:hypothetical protein
MAAPKGTQPPGGSRKGAPNKVTADVKAMILGALQTVGGERYLVTQARKNPKSFLSLLGRIMPMQVTGAEGRDLIPAEPPRAKVALALLAVLRGGDKPASAADGPQASEAPNSPPE